MEDFSQHSEFAMPTTRAEDHARQRAMQAAEELGRNPLVDWCSRLLTGETEPGADGDPDIALLGGMDAVEDFMGRVWAAQTLKYVWHRNAAGAVLKALSDSAWQVRAMALQVIAAHELSAQLEEVLGATDDAHPQVRSEALACLGHIVSVDDDEALKALESAVTSPDTVVSDAAESSLNLIAERFNRPELRPAPEY